MCCSKTNMDQLTRAKIDDKSRAKKIDKLVTDEDKIEHAMVRARTRTNGLTEADMNDLHIKCSKPNRYRESYGWFPSELVVNPINIFHDKLIVSNNGILNGDHENRIDKDKNKIISPTDDREAGRSADKNELSLRLFDLNQNLRFYSGRTTTTISPYISADDKRTTKQIFSNIKETAIKFSEKFNYWSWDNDSYRETNCHTLLFIILASGSLADPQYIGENLNMYFLRYKKSLEKNINRGRERKVNRKKRIENLAMLSKKAK